MSSTSYAKHGESEGHWLIAQLRAVNLVDKEGGAKSSACPHSNRCRRSLQSGCASNGAVPRVRHSAWIICCSERDEEILVMFM